VTRSVDEAKGGAPARVEAARAAVVAVFREEWGRLVATLIRLTGDWDLAEECAQDAFARALDRWPLDGIPDRPGAWLVTTARNRAVDRLRRKATETAKLLEVARMARATGPANDPVDDSGVPDDRLRLIFTCCHPALSLDAQVALTLRMLAGLTTAEIARAFLTSRQLRTWVGAGQTTRPRRRLSRVRQPRCPVP